MTEPGTLLGTIGYMAPEQARDPHAVDTRADLFSLGASMYWALTGREPYPETGNTIQDLHRRMTTSATPVRQVRPEVPVEVSDLVGRLMEMDPDQRYPSARAVAATLTGFALWLPTTFARPTSSPNTSGEKSRRERVLLVDDDDTIRRLMTQLLKDRYEIREAHDGEEALSEIRRNPPDLVVVDVNLPGVSGPDLITRMRRNGSRRGSNQGALDVRGDAGRSAGRALTSPARTTSWPSRSSQASSSRGSRALMLRRSPSPGQDAERGSRPSASPRPRPSARPRPPPRRSAPRRRPRPCRSPISRLLVETNLAAEGHWGRVVRYVRALAGAVTDQGEYARLKDDAYLDLLAAVAPIYDVGLLAVPRGMLMKPDKLDAEELAVMQTHTTVGSEVLMTVAGKLAAELPSLPLAAEVARSHHERWDGTGYPDQLTGTEIPLAARVVGLVAVYEACVRRPHRPPIATPRAGKIIANECPASSTRS